VLGKKKFIIGGIIICVAIVYLAYVGFASSATYYYTVSELIGQQSSVYDENVRINGQVAANSIEKETRGLILRFTITEGGESLPVVYNGVIPDTFQDDSDIVIEGHLNSEGVFQADSILTKCPSKYVPEE